MGPGKDRPCPGWSSLSSVLGGLLVGEVMPTGTRQGVSSSLLYQLAEPPTSPTVTPASLSHTKSGWGLEKSHEIVVGAF